MAGFLSRDAMTTAYANGQMDDWILFHNGLNLPITAGTWMSAWRFSGAGNPPPGAAPAASPGTAYATDQATTTNGAMWFPDRSPAIKSLYSFGAVPNATPTSYNSATFMLYDRLVGVSGISLATTGNKTVNSTALTRYTGTAAVNNEVWLEVTTATTTTAPVVNLNSYTSADGTTALSGGSVTFPSAATPIDTFIQLPLDASRRGVRSVEVGLNVGTAAAAGVVSLIILRPLARIVVQGKGYGEVNFFDDIMNPVQILDDATLSFAVLTGATNVATSDVLGKLKVVYG